MNKRDPKIAISGKSGCGNTTVSRLVAEKLGLRFINFTFRTLAQEMGLTLEAVLEKAKDDEWWDREVDRRQVELARQDGGCVLGSRLAIWMLPEADLKVYLKASPEVRLERIYKREGGDRAALASFTAERDRQDRERYLRLYNIDNNDYHFADIIIDTDHMGPEAIADYIIETLQKR
ncbi:(d)CMP kinase [Gracilinema caldarium]|uniref:(d)CMP kinase n=1 Tax=Gracilinema caldarium TaxID=215591 RepID=UPI0026EC8A23|nr:AAA family ATPase [Gracilinema caldarium]